MTTSQRSARAIVLLALGALFVFAASGAAKEIRVPGDYSNLEQAIREAKSGDKIVITAARTFRDNIIVRNARRLTITTNSRSRVATIEARRADEPALSLSSCSDILFENIVIQSGSYGVFATNCRDIVFQNTTVQSASVGVSASSSRGITFRDSLVTMHLGSGLVGSGYVLEETTVSRNHGWGLEIVGDEKRIGELGAELSATTISDNALGGALVRYLLMTAKETLVQENGGWGLEVADHGTVTMTKGSKESSISANALGGVHVVDATATLVARIADNGGVGALAERAAMDLVECTVSGQPETNLVYRNSNGSVSRSQVLASAAFGIDLQDSSLVTLVGTTVSGNRLGGAGVDASSHLQVTAGSAVSHNSPDGILVGGGTLTVSGSQIVGNAQHGVQAQNGSRLTIGTSTVAQNVVHGVFLDGATLTLDQTEVRENGQDGIHALAGSLATIENASHLSSNGRNGLYLDGSVGSLTGSEARANQANGLRAANSSHATGTDSTVSQNLGEGILLEASGLDLQNSNVTDNSWNGILARAASTLSVAGGLSRVARNGQNGILIDGSTASIGDCEVSDNQQHGVSGTNGSQTAMKDSTVSGNRVEGLLATSSTLAVENSTLRGNAANGIHVLARSILQVGGGKTLITLNGGDGILVEDSRATVNDCEVVDNVQSR